MERILWLVISGAMYLWTMRSATNIETLERAWRWRNRLMGSGSAIAEQMEAVCSLPPRFRPDIQLWHFQQWVSGCDTPWDGRIHQLEVRPGQGFPAFTIRR